MMSINLFTLGSQESDLFKNELIVTISILQLLSTSITNSISPLPQQHEFQQSIAKVRDDGIRKQVEMKRNIQETAQKIAEEMLERKAMLDDAEAAKKTAEEQFEVRQNWKRSRSTK
jgi:hypothetical protein